MREKRKNAATDKSKLSRRKGKRSASKNQWLSLLLLVGLILLLLLFLLQAVRPLPPTPGAIPPTRTPEPLTGQLLLGIQDFRDDDTGRFAIAIFDFASNTTTELIESDTSVYPQWSPDSSQILFTQTNYPESGHNVDIYVMDVESRNVRLLTDAANSDYTPAWSPDGTEIAFVSRRSGNIDLYIMDANGGNIRQLTNTPDIHEYTPRFSPDGTQIIFGSREMRLNETDLYIINVDGSGQSLIFHQDALFSGHTWSPDGTQFLFTSNITGEFELYVSDVDGSNVSQLSQLAGRQANAVWSPDGRHIAYTSNHSRRGTDIFVMDADGENIRQVTSTTNYYNEFTMAWRP